MNTESRFYQYMYYTLVLFALASNIAPAATAVAIGIGTLLVIYHRIALKTWPAFDKGLVRAFGIYFGVWLIVALNSVDVATSINNVIATFYRIFPLFFVMIGLKDRNQLKKVLIAFGISVFITDAVAAYQWGMHWEKRWFRPEGMSNVATVFGSHLIMAIAIGVAVLLDNNFSKYEKLVTLVLCVFTFVMLLASGTRGAWVALVFMIVLFLGLYPGNWRRSLKGLLAATLACALLFSFNHAMHDRVQSIFDTKNTSNAERILMWKSSIEMFKDYPIWGVGPDNFKLMYNTKYISPLAKGRPIPGVPHSGHGHPHNNFFTRLTEGGAVGALAFLILNAYIFKRLYSRFRNSQKDRTNIYALMGIVLFAGVHIAGLTDANFLSVPMMRELWFLVGISLIADELRCRG